MEDWELQYYLGQHVEVWPDDRWEPGQVSRPPAAGYGVWVRVAANGYEVLIGNEGEIHPV